VFDGWTWASMFRAFPREIGKVHILGRFTPTPVMDIADPWSGDDEVFRQCYRQISAGIESMLGQFLNSPAPEISTP